jgi:hypothetical protein
VIDWIAYPEQNYGYNGNYQTFIAPQDGEYMIELRGAAGAGGITYIGKGGYTKGVLNLRAGDELYVYVGGTSFNGGGLGRYSNDNTTYA